jgi:hypothetical protein
MLPHERDAYLRANPGHTPEGSDLTTLQWHRYAALRRKHGTGPAHEYAEAIKRALWHRKTQEHAGFTRGGALFFTLYGVAIKSLAILPFAYLIGGHASLAVGALAMGIYGILAALGSLIAGKPL